MYDQAPIIVQDSPSFDSSARVHTVQTVLLCEPTTQARMYHQQGKVHRGPGLAHNERAHTTQPRYSYTAFTRAHTHCLWLSINAYKQGTDAGEDYAYLRTDASVAIAVIQPWPERTHTHDILGLQTCVQTRFRGTCKRKHNKTSKSK